MLGLQRLEPPGPKGVVEFRRLGRRRRRDDDLGGLGHDLGAMEALFGVKV